ncbi:glyoxalase [Loktanella sp. IMCC34160]|uniref:glyoxalase n=1 Tax=Loktanella sp. IMCC34160 TaxID=2510646 RepID=UPI00101D9964|nr:glyoxalase [Loktanella sp. IMCC34160]RYG91554.1 glyoxalase [Loktanella sp. IMCC34160]
MSWTYDHTQLAIPKGGEDDARAFWVGILGMTELPKPEALAGRGGLWLRAGEVELHLGVEEPFSPARKAHPCFRVPDLDDIARRLVVEGHEVRWDTALTDRRRFFTDDPFCNRIEFT